MQVAPALACGNTFIYKPSQFTPAAAVTLGEVSGSMPGSEIHYGGNSVPFVPLHLNINLELDQVHKIRIPVLFWKIDKIAK